MVHLLEPRQSVVVGSSQELFLEATPESRRWRELCRDPNVLDSGPEPRCQTSGSLPCRPRRLEVQVPRLTPRSQCPRATASGMPLGLVFFGCKTARFMGILWSRVCSPPLQSPQAGPNQVFDCCTPVPPNRRGESQLCCAARKGCR